MMSSPDLFREPFRPGVQGRRPAFVPAAVLSLFLPCCTSLPAQESNALANAAFDQLLIHVQRPGTTEAKREAKRLAREELFARKAKTLEHLMARAHIENMWIGILAQELVGRLAAGEAVPVLLRRLASEHPRTRKLAAYFLGFYDTPEHANALLALLNDEEAAGAALRTLGKWRITKAAPSIAPFLKDAKGRRRVAAANALREIGDPSTAPALIEALGDEFFTVRKTAARALTALGRKAEGPVLRALPRTDRATRRELIPILAGMRTRRARRALGKLAASADLVVRAEAAHALAAASR